MNFKNFFRGEGYAKREGAIETGEKKPTSKYEAEQESKSPVVKWLEDYMHDHVINHHGGYGPTMYDVFQKIKELGDNPTMEEAEELRRKIVKGLGSSLED